MTLDFGFILFDGRFCLISLSPLLPRKILGTQRKLSAHAMNWTFVSPPNPPNLYIEALLPSVMVQEVGCLGRNSG